MDSGSSKKWDKYYSNNQDFKLISSEELSKCLGYLNTDSEKTCLDVGCGTGQLSRELFHRGYTVSGIDISDSAIALAKQNSIYSGKGLTYLQCDIENDSDSVTLQSKYSLITCKLVYAFIKNKPGFLKKIHSLLSDNGTFIIITPTLDEITPEKRNIAVDADETLAEIQKVFSKVTHYKKNSLTYFIVQK